MERKQNGSIIRLRFLVIQRGNKFEAICLDTNIANRANTLESIKQKIFDSTSLYLRSFSKEEIADHVYIRKAPLKYHILWYMPSIANIFLPKYSHDKAEFDASSGKLSFA